LVIRLRFAQIKKIPISKRWMMRGRANLRTGMATRHGKFDDIRNCPFLRPLQAHGDNYSRWHQLILAQPYEAGAHRSVSRDRVRWSSKSWPKLHAGGRHAIAGSFKLQ
jgi:hypothetical protein